jgi:hypothetical protein
MPAGVQKQESWNPPKNKNKKEMMSQKINWEFPQEAIRKIVLPFHWVD